MVRVWCIGGFLSSLETVASIGAVEEVQDKKKNLRSRVRDVDGDV